MDTTCTHLNGIIIIKIKTRLFNKILHVSAFPVQEFESVGRPARRRSVQVSVSNGQSKPHCLFLYTFSARQEVQMRLL